MKGHVEVDSKERIIHSFEVTSINIHDSQDVEAVLPGREAKVWGDRGYEGKKAAIKKATQIFWYLFHEEVERFSENSKNSSHSGYA